jgi:hypothetical protein
LSTLLEKSPSAISRQTVPLERQGRLCRHRIKVGKVGRPADLFTLPGGEPPSGDGLQALDALAQDIITVRSSLLLFGSETVVVAGETCDPKHDNTASAHHAAVVMTFEGAGETPVRNVSDHHHPPLRVHDVPADSETDDPSNISFLAPVSDDPPPGFVLDQQPAGSVDCPSSQPSGPMPAQSYEQPTPAQTALMLWQPLTSGWADERHWTLRALVLVCTVIWNGLILLVACQLWIICLLLNGLAFICGLIWKGIRFIAACIEDLFWFIMPSCSCTATAHLTGRSRWRMISMPPSIKNRFALRH